MSKSIRVRGTSDNERKPAIYEKLEDDTIKFYCSNGYRTMTQEQFDDITSKPKTSSHIMVQKEKRHHDVLLLSLKDQYELFIKEADKLKLISDGKVNLYKTGNVARTALSLFYSFDVPLGGSISFKEMEIMEACKNGGLIWGEEYKGKAYKYDIVSQYPAIMRSDHMTFPIKAGKLKTMKKPEFEALKYFSYGIYHVKVHGADYRLFKTNEDNWYTHICLNRAMTLKYKIELVEDGESNALLYEGCLVNGAKLFRPYVDYLFQFKNAGHKEVKKYLNALWGKLCMLDKFEIQLNDKDNDCIRDDKFLLQLLPTSTDCTNFTATLQRKGQTYDTNYARIKPFLASKARCQMSCMIEKNLSNVKRCYVDGIILSKRIKDVKLGENIGELKFEKKSKKCTILNARDVLGFETDDEIIKLQKRQYKQILFMHNERQSKIKVK